MTPAERLRSTVRSPPESAATAFAARLAAWLPRAAGPVALDPLTPITIAAAVALLLFTGPQAPLQDLAYLLVVPLCWITVRATPISAAVAFGAVSVIAIVAASLGTGPFVGERVWLELALMLGLFAAIMLSTAVLVEDRARYAAALLAANRSLEDLVAARTAALARSEEQFRSMVEIAPLPLLLVRAADRAVVYLNPRAAELLALSPVTAIGRPLPDLFAEATDREALDYMIRRNGAIRDFEVELRPADGRTLWALLSISTVSYGAEAVLLIGINDITGRRKLEDDLRLRATIDGLTGIANRTHFMDTGDLEVHRARRYSRPLSLVLIDLDHFKQVNDSHGHGAGDRVIREAVRACLGALRSIDRMGRLGGEEFAALLPETGAEGAIVVAERLRSAIEALSVDLDDGSVIAPTASIGVATLADDDPTRIDGLIARADRALYQAKRSGRNRVAVDGPIANFRAGAIGPAAGARLDRTRAPVAGAIRANGPEP